MTEFLPNGSGATLLLTDDIRGPVTVAELTDFAAASLGRFQVPARWWLHPDPLPMTDAGKDDKRTLRAAWPATIGHDSSSAASPAV
jgi:acyl-CoA synthetase (AMP-forming)/AMP-acid ligase II